MVRKYRAGERGRLIWSAVLITRTGPVPARLANLSEGGAKVAIQKPIDGLDDVILQTKQMFAAARVVWTKDGEAGLEFYREQPVSPPLPAVESVA